MSFLTFADLGLTFDSRVSRSKRFQRVTFGDGYSQILGDGLNAEQETWNCITPVMSGFEAFSIEANLKRYADTAIEWSPPDSNKSFQVQFIAGTTALGYTNLSALDLDGYTRPTDYTANLSSGVLTSVTIPNSRPVKVTITESPKKYLIREGWELNFIAPDLYQITFDLQRIYV
jgi:phage-related protein